MSKTMEKIEVWGQQATVHNYDALIIGSGCAGLNAADSLHSLGYTNIALVTEGMNMGTSRNTGSDKQTYYKLAWQSGESDNTEKMAQALFSGKSVHGDLAFAEAAGSVRCFMKLVNLGVPFPTNEFGEYVGYQTDHTTEKRATSAGPLTSKYMTEALEREVCRRNVSIIDQTVIVELVHDANGILGAVGLNRRKLANKESGLYLFLANNIILATGGPASIYRNRVYPASQTGMSSLAMDAGAWCENLEEWQYGLASFEFRWNLSGTYQQVLPRYVSVDSEGVEREFLYDYFDDPVEAVNQIFLKGYQWPFDAEKLKGSTIIDMIVYNEEINLGRKVYLDFRREPKALKDGLEVLTDEAYQYLKCSDALLPIPICRLEKMNPKAIELYRSHGIDLYTQMLRITVAAQHCNGGVAVDANWQTNIPGLYAAGEAAATFGVYRPGGTALNSTQVGSLRAAEHIVRENRQTRKRVDTLVSCAKIAPYFFEKKIRTEKKQKSSRRRLLEIEKKVAADMSAYGAQLRNVEKLRKVRQMISAYMQELSDMASGLESENAVQWFKTRDMLVTAQAVVESILYAAEHIGSRGGSICCEKPIDFTSAERIRKTLVHTDSTFDSQVLRYRQTEGCSFAPVRPLPKTELWFEKVWEQYQKREAKISDSSKDECSIH